MLRGCGRIGFVLLVSFVFFISFVSAGWWCDNVGIFCSGNADEVCRVIDQPGTFILDQDVTGVDGVCFDIKADNVTFDGNGHKISMNSGDYYSYGVGIYANNIEQVFKPNLLNAGITKTFSISEQYCGVGVGASAGGCSSKWKRLSEAGLNDSSSIMRVDVIYLVNINARWSEWHSWNSYTHGWNAYAGMSGSQIFNCSDPKYSVCVRNRDDGVDNWVELGVIYGNESNGGIMVLKGVKNLTIKNLTIEGSDNSDNEDYSRGIVLENVNDSFVSNVTFDGGGYGINIDNSYDNVFEGISASGNYNSFVYFSSSANNTFSNVDIITEGSSFFGKYSANNILKVESVAGSVNIDLGLINGSLNSQDISFDVAHPGLVQSFSLNLPDNLVSNKMGLEFNEFKTLKEYINSWYGGNGIEIKNFGERVYKDINYYIITHMSVNNLGISPETAHFNPSWEEVEEIVSEQPYESLDSVPVSLIIDGYVPPVCGDLILSGNCLSMQYNDYRACTGAGFAWVGEQCDDGRNGIDTDQCYDNCTLTFYGDDIIQRPNGLENYDEQCDTLNLNGETCESLGFDSGVLRCESPGIFDTSMCNNAVCGDGICGGDENGCDCPQDCSGGSCMKVYLDKKYVDDTLAKRKFIPNKITPYDDIVCEVPVSWADAAGKLMTKDDSGEWTVEVGAGVFDANGIWKIKGWNYDGSNGGMGRHGGWSRDYAAMEQVVKTGAVKCIAINGAGNKISLDNSQQPNWAQEYSNCVHVWGANDAKYPIAVAMAKSYNRATPGVAVSWAIGTKIYSFDQINPLGAYPNVFSYFADLKEVNDIDGISLLEDIKYIKAGNGNVDLVPNEFIAGSSCGADKTLLVYNKRTNCGYSWPDNDGRFVAWGVGVGSICEQIGWLGITHEFGHNIGGLADEYNKVHLVSPHLRWAIDHFYTRYAKNNCVKKTWAGNLPWGNYGEFNWSGCEFYPDAYRPSEKSIMNLNELFLGQFNIVSCGYVLHALNGCSPIENCWTQCEYMTNVIQPRRAL